jgi:hypothetical protein
MERLPLATMQPAPCRSLSLAKVFKVFGMEPAAWEVFRWRKTSHAASSMPAGGHGARGSFPGPGKPWWGEKTSHGGQRKSFLPTKSFAGLHAEDFREAFPGSMPAGGHGAGKAFHVPSLPENKGNRAEYFFKAASIA